MAAADSEHLVDGKYGIADLVDLDQLRDIFAKFTRATGFTIGFLDHPGLNILVATGWRDICTKFHRVGAASEGVCRKSNKQLLDRLTRPRELVVEACDHGLVDCATPIIVKGKHIASLATGQLLLAKPDRERFRAQARAFGFDEEAYLKALDEVPVVTEEQLRHVTDFLGCLAAVVSELGYANLSAREESARLEQEVAERTRAEAALSESERKYRSLIETTGTGYAVIDLDGHIVDANAEYVRLTGRSTLAEILGRSVAEWTAAHDAARNADAIRLCAEQGFTRHHEVDYTDAAGRSTPVELTATILPTAEGTRIVALCRDITERKRAEAQRARIETQMLQVQKLESLGVLAGGIAHDFNNLLMGILGNIDLALTDLPALSPIRANLVDVSDAARQAADLCRQMLAYSGRGRFVLRALDVRDLVREMGHMLDVSVSKKAALRYVLADDAAVIEGDPSQIRQVVMNLVINASEALGDANGVITVSVGTRRCDRAYLADSVVQDGLAEGSYVCIEVADTGCGMDAATLARVFEPFFTTKFTGRGLGLAAVLGIVRGHKGTLVVHSEPGRGSSFRALFPAVACAPDPGPVATATGAAWKGSGIVLLADDERTVRDIGRRMLERLGFQVVLAEDGEAAVRRFHEIEAAPGARIRCVILDLTMPGKDGLDAFREIRGLRRDVPILLSSGYNEQEVTQQFVGRDLTGFIQKPYRVNDLAAKLRAALGE